MKNLNKTDKKLLEGTVETFHLDNMSEEPFKGSIIVVRPAEAQRLGEQYQIPPIEVTRLVQIRNLDSINSTEVLRRKFMQTVRQSALFKKSGDENLFEYWNKRKQFMKEFFFMAEKREAI